MLRWLLCICFIHIIPAMSWGGSAGTEFPVSLGTDARSQALGFAATALSQDSSAIFWNPAGLGFIERGDVSAMYIPLETQMDYGFFGLAYPAPGLGTLGFGLAGLWTRDLAKTDANDNDMGTFTDLQAQFLLSYARAWGKNFSTGGNVKIFHHALDDHTGTGIGVDLGLGYKADAWLPGLSLGFMAENILAPRVTLISQAETYPWVLKFGAAYGLAVDAAANHVLSFSLEAGKSAWAQVQAHGGLEYRLFQLFSLRGGWDADRPTAGLGMSFWDLRLDYAITWPQALGILQTFSLGWSFGPSLHQQEEARRAALVLEITQAQAQLFRQRGLAHLRNKEHAQAVDALETASRWDESSAEILQDLKTARAAQVHDQAVKSNQEGWRYFKQNQFFNAFAAWRETAELEPAFPGVLKQMLQAREALAQSTRPSKSIRGARPLSVRHSAQFQNGVDAYLEGNFEQAIAHWQKIPPSDPQFSEIQPYVARAQKKISERKRLP